MNELAKYTPLLAFESPPREGAEELTGVILLRLGLLGRGRAQVEEGSGVVGVLPVLLLRLSLVPLPHGLQELAQEPQHAHRRLPRPADPARFISTKEALSSIG